MRSNSVGCLSVSKKKTSLPYRLRVGSSVIDELTPEESLDLVLKVIWGDLEDDQNLNASASTLDAGHGGRTNHKGD